MHSHCAHFLVEECDVSVAGDEDRPIASNRGPAGA